MQWAGKENEFPEAIERLKRSKDVHTFNALYISVNEFKRCRSSGRRRRLEASEYGTFMDWLTTPNWWSHGSSVDDFQVTMEKKHSYLI